MTKPTAPTWTPAQPEQTTLFDTDAPPPAPVPVDEAVLAAAELVLGPGHTVLPPTEISGIYGCHPVIRWTEHLPHRLAGEPPMLDRRTLSLWEFSPHDPSYAPPTPLVITGIIATHPRFGRARHAAAELRGFGEGIVLTRSRPTALSLTSADLASVTVVRATADGHPPQVLVTGAKAPNTRRCTIVRYWEERLFAHALATGRAPTRHDPHPSQSHGPQEAR